MPRPKEDQKAEILNAIHEHLKIDGPGEWNKLFEKYPDVSRATMWRYIKQAREKIEDAAGKHGAGALREAQKRIRQHVEPVAKTQERVKAHLPVAPSPAVIAGQDAKVEQLFNFFAYFQQIIADTDLVRTASVAKNDDGTERLKNPKLMSDNVRQRLGILETYLHAMSEVYNFQKIQDLYKIVIDAVGQADPETQQVILARLRQANALHGFTLDARV